MKKIFIFTMSLFSFLVASAYDFESNGFYYNILSLSDLTAQVTCAGAEDELENKVASYSGDITIPATVEYSGRTFTVTSINEYAFHNCFIGTLTIPANVISISKKAIDGNHQKLSCMRGTFTNLVIEDSDVPIECWRGLVSGQVTGSVYLGRNIGGEQMGFIVYGDGQYSAITFGDKVTSLDNACENCKNLTSVTLPESIKSLDGTFNNCISLSSVTAPGVETIIDSFYGCTSLETIDIPNLKIISDGAFAACTNLKNCVLPQGLIRLGDTRHGGDAFENCTNLEAIVLPATLQSIGDENSSIFKGCEALTDITVNNPIPVFLAETNFDASTYINATLKVPTGSLEAYKNADGWKNFFNIVEDASITDDIYTLFIDKDNIWDGSISVECDEVLPEYDSYKFVKKGSNVKVVATPERNCKLSALYVNGVDVIADVVDNTYVTTMQGSMTISANFEWDDSPEEDIYLSIKQADNGNVKLKVSKWNEYQVVFEPAEGWRLHSVSFNGADVTEDVSSDNSYRTPEITENSELIVVYVSDPNAIGEVRLTSSSAKVVGSSGNIIVSNAEEDETVYVYTTAGTLVKTVVANNGTSTIRVQENEVYIVKVGNKTFKIGM